MADEYTEKLHKLSTADLKSVSTGDFQPICEGCIHEEEGQEGHMGDCGCLGAHWTEDEDEWNQNKELIITEAKKILDQRPTGLKGISMDSFASQARTFNKSKLRKTLKSKVAPGMVDTLEKGYGIKMPPQRKLPAWLVKINKKTQSSKKGGRRKTCRRRKTHRRHKSQQKFKRQRTKRK